MLKHFRRYMVAGILVWLPIGVTVFLLRILIGLMDRTLLLLPAQYRPEILFGFSIPGLGFVLTIVVLLVTGILAANIVGRSMVSLWETLLDRIPIVRSIYSGAGSTAGRDDVQMPVLVKIRGGKAHGIVARSVVFRGPEGPISHAE